MNGSTLLDWLLARTNANASGWECARWAEERRLDDAIFELCNRKDKRCLPERISDPEAALAHVAEHFHDDVSLTSLVLSAYYPDRYAFYRVGAFDAAIVEGLSVLGSAIPELGADGATWAQAGGIGRKGIERYKDLNSGLVAFAGRMWPDDPPHRPSLMYFLYEGLGRLFSRESDFRTHWLVIGSYMYFDKDPGSSAEMDWSARHGMQDGDVVLMHRSCKRTEDEPADVDIPDASKKSMLTDVYRVAGQPTVDPWGAWEGFWTRIRRVATLSQPLRFAQFRADPVLQEWSLVKKQFVGVTCEPIPYRYYNRLLDLMDTSDVEAAGLQPEDLGKTKESGTYESEADFDVREVGPLFRSHLGLRAAYQKTEAMYVGNKRTVLRLDYLISDAQGPLTVVEDDFSIPSVNDKRHVAALGQARSYALLLGLPSCMVAAPEGYWLYEMRGTEAKLCEGFDGLSHQEIVDRRDEVRAKLIELRKRHPARRR